MLKRSVDDRLISIVVPMHNEEDNIDEFYLRISTVLNSITFRWELICVNDGSTDKTNLMIKLLRERDKRVKLIDLSRNFGKENALTAGLDYANGEIIIPIDADLQDPPEIIPEMLELWSQGYDVVNAARRTRSGETGLKRFTSYAFYRVFSRIVNFKVSQDTGDFRLMSSNVIKAIGTLRERRRFMKGIFAWVGFDTCTIYYDRAPRTAGKTSWNYMKLISLAFEGITSFTHVPLQVASYLGIIVSLGSFLYGLYIFLRTIILGSVLPGYPSMMIVILFLGGVQLISLGLLGEYIGRIYEESKGRPIYLVKNTDGFSMKMDLINRGIVESASALDIET